MTITTYFILNDGSILSDYPDRVMHLEHNRIVRENAQPILYSELKRIRVINMISGNAITLWERVPLFEKESVQ